MGGIIQPPISSAIRSPLGGRLRPAGNRVALAGHSMNEQQLQSVLSPRAVSMRGMAAIIASQTRGRVQFREEDKTAVSGSLIKDIYTTVVPQTNNPKNYGKTQLDLLLAGVPRVVYLHTGHNDIANGVSLAQMTTGTGDDGKGLAYVLDTLVRAGFAIVLDADLPSGNSSFTSVRYTASQLKVALGFRDWVIRVAPALWPGAVYPVDFWPVLADRAAGTLGDIKAGMTQDGVHPNLYASYLMAPVLTSVLVTALGLAGMPDIHQPGDLYDATYNPRGNRITYGDLVSTAAIDAAQNAGITTSGVRPNPYNLFQNVNSGSALTVTGSEVTGTSTGDWYRLAIGGTTNATAGQQIGIKLYPGAIPGAGTILAPFGEFEVLSSGTGLVSLELKLIVSRGAANDTISLGANFGSAYTALDGILASGPITGAWNGDLVSAPFVGDETAVSLYVIATLKESATMSLTINLRNMALRNVA